MNELSIFNSLFNDVFGSEARPVVYAASPRVDVTEDDSEYKLEMELPGRSEKDVSIELDHDNLTIASKIEESEENKSDKKDKAKKYILQERRYSSFSRRFTLPSDVDEESITANFKNGVLTIDLKKKPIAKPKKIAIEAC
ncbi:MAG: Hsp20/alpha crystallin family protein [Treponema sp.]|nr:Hsp20/alpha crystallin family protein [Treponema sp.]